MGTWFTAHSYLIPTLPFLSFVLLSLFVRPLSARVTAILATATVWASCVLAWGVAYEYVVGGTHGISIPFQLEWLRYQESLVVSAGVLLDPISILLMIVVTTVSSLVHLYSLGYMAHEEGKARFFVFLNLFTSSMLGLVCAPNILQTFVCWELVGASSFLLIGYYYQRPAAVSASKKAFIVTRFADLGFLLGILILGSYGHMLFPAGASGQPFDYLYLGSPAFLDQFSLLASPVFGLSMLTLALLLIFAGAAGKSAMFPLHVWLPDAMEGPTPVSALIHAATMVVAGVYLVARLFPLFAYSETALAVVACVGAFTCLFAALIGCTQDDLKRVLAFSTLSQLGYMMLALGVASVENPLGYTASMFHLFTHAFFKAQLFLCAGILIHAAHTNSVWEMGGLARKMPFTHVLFLIAVLAISGIWPFAGFFSKDEILIAALTSGHHVVFGVALAVAGLTAFYMSRIYFLCFWGTSKNSHLDHVHNVSLFELIPVSVLALFAIGAGFIPVGHYVFFGATAPHAEHESIVPILGTIAAITGIGMAWLLYTGERKLVQLFVRNLGGVYTMIRRKFYIDEVYLFVVHKLIFRFVSAPFAWFDRHIVDGAVNVSGWCVRAAGGVLSRLQTGHVQTYGSWLFNGLVGLILFFWFAAANGFIRV